MKKVLQISTELNLKNIKFTNDNSVDLTYKRPLEAIHILAWEDFDIVFLDETSSHIDSLINLLEKYQIPFQIALN